MTVKVDASVSPVILPVKLAGARSEFKKVDGKSKKLFNDYKAIITKKLQKEHKITGKFVPKPEKVATQVVNGALYHYLVKVPANKYAYVTIRHQGWKKDLYGKEDNVNVRPQLYALNEKNF